MSTIVHDIRYALRSFRFSIGFTAVAVTLLALGTGANTAIFQLFDAIRLRTLPVRAPQELVEFRVDDMTHARGNWLRSAALTNPLWEKIRNHEKNFSGLFAWANEAFEISPEGQSHEVNGLWVSGNFFRVLGVTPVLGRVFTANDDRRGCGSDPGAVISYGFWQQQFGGDPAVIGQTLAIGRNRIRVAGVTPPGFFGLEVGRTFDVALPVCSEPTIHGSNERLDSGITWWLTVMARRTPGVSVQQESAMSQAQSPEIFRATLPAGYPAESVKPYLRMKLIAIPAGYGLSQLRQQYARALILLLSIAGLCC